MQIINVPIFNKDGSISLTHVLTAQEAQVLLQFALNFLASTGLSVRMLMEESAKQAANPDGHDITVQ